MHYNYMTGEQWRIRHSVSHRFPFWDKEDKHSALLLQEGEKKTSSAVSWRRLDGRWFLRPRLFASRQWSVPCGEAGRTKRGSPAPRCVRSASCGSLSPAVLAHRSSPAAPGTAAVCFCRALPALGETRQASVGSRFVPGLPLLQLGQEEQDRGLA